MKPTARPTCTCRLTASDRARDAQAARDALLGRVLDWLGGAA